MPENQERYLDSSKMVNTTNDLDSSDNGKAGRILNYDFFINAKAQRTTPSVLRESIKIFSNKPHLIPFAGGVPNETTFPFKKFSVDLKDGSNYNIEGNDVDVAFQYMPTVGYPVLIKQLQKLTDCLHGAQDWDSGAQALIMCNGAQDALSSVFNIVLSEGEPVIMPVPLYSGAADVLRSIKPKYIGVEQDKDGVDPQKIRAALEEIVQQNKTLPKLMYINPTGCNPTGTNLTIERKEEIYKIACEYNFIILEDDPYYFLHFAEITEPSFLSMDTVGRVLRMDTFSKVLGAGLRLGYITGPSQLIRRIETHIQLSTLHASSLSQVVVSRLLDHWSYEQLLEHTDKLKAFYRERRDLMVAACDRYLKGLAEWDVPLGGMFLWLKVIVLPDTWTLAMENCMEKYLVIIAGHPFAGELVPDQYNYIRLSFSLATPQQIEQGIKILSEVIQEEMKKINP